jgi:hypothetical protein
LKKKKLAASSRLYKPISQQFVECIWSGALFGMRGALNSGIGARTRRLAVSDTV